MNDYLYNLYLTIMLDNDDVYGLCKRISKNNSEALQNHYTDLIEIRSKPYYDGALPAAPGKPPTGRDFNNIYCFYLKNNTTITIKPGIMDVRYGIKKIVHNFNDCNNYYFINLNLALTKEQIYQHVLFCNGSYLCEERLDDIYLEFKMLNVYTDMTLNVKLNLLSYAVLTEYEQ
jgi:hypothetical protein